MVSSLEKPYWSPADADQTKIFLDSITGQRLLARLMYHAPEYGRFISIEERAVMSGKREGYEMCILSAQSLRQSDPERKVSSQ